MRGAVLVVGATGNIGVAVTIATLKTGRHVIAPVRNSASAAKLFEHVGTRDGITAVEADVTSEDGIQSIVDRVEAGTLPAFQHVYSSSAFPTLLVSLRAG
jgi:NAD(P)-dependent dehydrogenase (short-subunit alcohol dehydrogenase family)